jgi:MFS superfamily sulfate permease-like transporter
MSALIGFYLWHLWVRTSANNAAGANRNVLYTRVLLLISVLVIPVILNKIPLATLAILILVGYKLAKQSYF